MEALSGQRTATWGVLVTVTVVLALVDAATSADWTYSYDLNDKTPRAVFSFRPSNVSGSVLILLVDTRESLQASNLYYIAIQNSKRGHSYLLQCPGYGSWSESAKAAIMHPLQHEGKPMGTIRVSFTSMVVELPSNHMRTCNLKMVFQKTDGNFKVWDTHKDYSFMVDVVNDGVRVWMDDRMYEWLDRNTATIGSYWLGTQDFSGDFERYDSMMTTHYAENESFCGLREGCKCLPGYEEKFCTKLCGKGRYGANCLHRCGACAGGACDPLTGECSLGCRPGFLPPLCQNNSVRLLRSPEITYVGSGSVSWRADLKSENLEGVGKPVYCQAQYRLVGAYVGAWLSTAADKVAGDSAQGAITGLSANTRYQLRLVLFGDNNSTLEDDTLPTTYVRTKCSVSDGYEYKLEARPNADKRMIIHWNIRTYGVWCPVKNWTVELRKANSTKWTVHPLGEVQSVSMAEVGVTDAEYTYDVRIQAVTEGGDVLRHSDPILVTTYQKAVILNSKVGNLSRSRVTAHTAEITWTEPQNLNGIRVEYLIQYECKALLVCPVNCSGITQKVYKPEAKHEHRYVLDSLRPYALHRVAVVPRVMNFSGRPAIISIQTLTGVPTAAPERGRVRVTNVTSDSFTVRWTYSKDCFNDDSKNMGMRFNLTRGDGRGYDDTGIAIDNVKHFTSLNSNTLYYLRLHLVAFGSWNEHQYITLNITTLPSGVGPLEDLTVYKRKQDELHLRWITPDSRDGVLQRFNISYRKQGQSNLTESKAMRPEFCKHWTHMHCYRLSGLQPNTFYNVSIQAIFSDGSASNQTSVTAVTTEHGPAAPEHLTISNVTPTSLTLQWNLPNMTNGELRNFIVTVHHLSSSRQDGSIFYVLNATDEIMVHTMQLVKLRPASSYLIGVTAVTAVMGSTSNITAHTAPARPKLPRGSISVRDGPSSCLQLILPLIDTNPQLIQSYMILLIPNWEEKKWKFPNITNTEVARQLKENIPTPFHILKKMSKMPADGRICVTYTKGTGKGKLIMGSKYQVGLAVVLAYKNAYTVATTETDVFSLLHCYGTYTRRDTDRYTCF